ADVDALVAGAPVAVGWVQRAPGEFFQQGAGLGPDGEGAGGAAADVVDLPGSAVDVAGGGLEGARQVVHIQNVAHLLAVAVDGEGLARRGADGQEGDPALVFDAELAGAIDGALAEDDGGQPVDAVIV